MLAALFNVPANLGYPLLFALVAGESAGAWIPGETALIVAASLASQGKLSLPIVIGIAAAAAIVGDNVGYQIGRRGLRPLANRPLGAIGFIGVGVAAVVYLITRVRRRWRHPRPGARESR
jgi:membrane protein DedA with SNARE-associated domain